MKRLNFNQQVSDDDEELVDILKESTVREPSEQFVENTLERFFIHRTKQNRVHKPLRPPLYMMLIIGLILLVPTFFSFSSRLSLPDSGLELENLFENMSYSLDSWYTLTPMVLIVILMSVVWVELGLFKFRNPFI